MLLNCKFQRRTCTTSDFAQYHNYFYGNCYRFNAGKNSAGKNVDLKMINQAGWNFGLEVVESFFLTKTAQKNIQTFLGILVAGLRR